MPASIEELLKIPGIGTYSASAIACFAFGRDVTIVDSNIRRIVKRFLGTPSMNDTGVMAFLNERGIPERTALFNYALLDLGALVCRPSRPNCSGCPLKEGCSSTDSRRDSVAHRSMAGVGPDLV